MNRRRVLVTGAQGFLGRHVCRALHDAGAVVVGISRTARDSDPDLHRFRQIPCNVLELSALQQVVKDFQPEYVLHFAGLGKVEASWQRPAAYVQTNAGGTLYLLEALHTFAPALQRVIVIGSMHEYEFAANGGRLDECSPVRPQNPYGWSKWISASVAEMYRTSFHMPIVTVRLFGVIGPGATGGVLVDLARQVADVEQGHREPVVEIGNPALQRDFLDVRDAVRAFIQLLVCHSLASVSVVNVCSGRPTAIQELVNLLQQQTTCPFTVQLNSNWRDRGEPAVVVGSHRILTRLTGWNPEVNIEQSVRDMLEEARSAIRGTHRRSGGEND